MNPRSCLSPLRRTFTNLLLVPGLMSLLAIGNGLVQAATPPSAPAAPTTQARVRNRHEPEVTVAEAKVLADIQNTALPQALKKLRAAATSEAGPAIWFALGVYNEKAGNLRAAEKALTTATQKMPDFYRARLALAEVLRQEQKETKATTQLVYLLNHNAPDRARCWTLLAAARLNLDQPIAAEAAARQALALTPDSTLLRLILLRAVLAQGDTRRAQGLARLELIRQPENPELWRVLAGTELALGRRNDALVHLECARRLKLLSIADTWKLAGLFLERDYPQLAADLYRETAKTAPISPAQICRAAENLLNAGLFADAQKIAALLPPKSVSSHTDRSLRQNIQKLRARLAQSRGDEAAAIRLYTQLLQDQPLAAEPALHLARLLTKQQRFDEAARYFKRVAHKDSAAAALRAEAWLGLARLAIARNNKPQTIHYLLESLKFQDRPWVRQYLRQLQEE